jgi:hypothetical protein
VLETAKYTAVVADQPRGLISWLRSTDGKLEGVALRALEAAAELLPEFDAPFGAGVPL